jgi:hypothetical protein
VLAHVAGLFGDSYTVYTLSKSNRSFMSYKHYDFCAQNGISHAQNVAPPSILQIAINSSKPSLFEVIWVMGAMIMQWQGPMQISRFPCSQHHWFMRVSRAFEHLTDVDYVAACAPPHRCWRNISVPHIFP